MIQMTNTIRLQSIGEVDAVPASEIKAGDVRMYNFGSTGIVIKVIEKSSKTLQLITFENGKYFMFDIRKTTLVSIARRGEDVSMHQPQEAYVRKVGMVDVSEHFKVEEVEVVEDSTEVSAIQTIESIPVKFVTFKWSEASHIIKDNTVVSTLKEANDLVYNVAYDMGKHEEMGYRKTSFIIEWNDGRTHEGRIDIETNHASKLNPIGDHVKHFYESLAGLRKPSQWTEEQYKNYLKNIYKIDEAGMEEMKMILSTYLLVDSENYKPESTTEIVVTETNMPKTIVQPKLETKKDIKVKYNNELNGVELYFASIPSVETRELLKAHKFRWSKKGFWYTKQSAEAMELVNRLTLSLNNDDMHTEIEETVMYPEIEIDDLNQYIVTDQLQSRVHSASLFEVDYKKECVEIFKSIQNAAVTILETTNNSKIKYQIKTYLQTYKKSYYELYLKILNHRANNPSWAVTGRGGMNVRRYNKMQNRYDDLLRQSVELSNQYEKQMNKFKRLISKDNQAAFEKEYNSKLNELEITPNFTTETKEIDFMGVTERLRTYNYDGYTVAKTWGMYRIFKNGKEVTTNLKTNSKLDDAKKYVLYLASS